MSTPPHHYASSLLDGTIGLIERERDPDLGPLTVEFLNGLGSFELDRRSPEHRVAGAFRAWLLDSGPLDHRSGTTLAAVQALAHQRPGPDRIEAGDLIAVLIANESWGSDAIEALRTRLDQNAWAYLRKRLELTGLDLEPDEVLARFTADTVHAHHDDLIGGVEREAMAFARVCAATTIDPPLAIGVFGQWGSGKSYFMEKVHASVAELSRDASEDAPTRDLFHHNIVQIRFNAWHYIETNLWASLVEHIFAELDSWLRRQAERNQKKDEDDVDRLFERLSTSRLLKLEAVDTLVTSREREQLAAAVVKSERDNYKKALAAQQAEREAAFPWPAVIEAFKPELDDAFVTAGKQLGFAHLVESGEKLARVYEQSVDARGRALLMINALSGRFGRTWPLFILIVLAVTLLPWGIRAALDSDWDTIGAAISSACLVVATVGGMIGNGLSTASQAISTIESKRKTFDEKVEEQQRALRKVLSEAEDHLAKVQADVDRAELHLTEAERDATAAAEAFNSGSARGRLNRFIRDKVTSGDYARHLGLVTSIRRDFVELARLMREAQADTNRYDLEAERFEADYRRRVEATIVHAAATYCARVERLRAAWAEGDELPPHIAKFVADADDYKAKVEALIGHALPLPDKPAPNEHVAEPRPILTLAEIARLWAGLGERDQTKPPAFDRIILYIDDLDRCPPEKVVKVLQAAHLLLGFRLFVVLIAVDERWVSRALTHHYDQMLAEPDAHESHDLGAASSHDYLEKIFQLPYWVRPMSDKASTSFVAGLLAREQSQPASEAGEATQDEDHEQAKDAEPTSEAETETEAELSTAEPSADPETDAATAPVIEAMVLSESEREFMVELAKVDSPRRGKRFVNAYRLIKASLPPPRLATFVREGKSEAYRAVLVQLGIATGAPTTASAYFEVLERAKSIPELLDWARQLEPRDPDDRDRLVAMLEVAKGKVSVDGLREWTSIAARYSFVRQANK